MKTPKDIEDLASTLKQAASAPLVADRADRPEPPKRSKKTGSMSVFLRLPPDLHATLEAEAVRRTKATGKGVTVQQIILDKLGAP